MKKAMRWSLGLLGTVVLLALALPAGTATAATKPTTKKKADQHPTVYWEISAADATAKTIELQKSDNSSNLTLKVTAATKLTANSKPIKLADLQKGQKVTFTASGDFCSTLDVVADKKKK